jgi:hypothetical protein
MDRRVGTRLLSSFPLLLSSMLGGCYAHHTADEELLDIEFPDEVYPDAGPAAPADAGSANRCTQTDPIQLLICQFTQGGGGLGNLPGLGGTGTNNGSGTGTQTPDLGGIQDLIDQLIGGGGSTGATGGGLQDIIDLLGGLQGGGTTRPGTGTGQLPSLEDLLGQFGRRDAGAPVQQMPAVTEQQCASATTVQLRFVCAINGFATPSQGRRDGGTGFTWPFPTGRDAGAGTPDSSVPSTLL